MDGRKLQDRLYLGLGRSARYIGQWAEAFRPSGPSNPLDKQNRFLRLPAAFVSAKGNESRTNTYGEPLWHGIFDASYTRTGDYIVLGSRIFFVASQEHLLPVLCVAANHTISIVRPNVQGTAAANPYGGYTSAGSVILMEAWPASVLSESRTSASAAGLPADQAVPYWNLLMPSAAQVILSPGDMINDDLGRTAVIAGSELTNLGWRINAKLATT
jgi:hypothetical protein